MKQQLKPGQSTPTSGQYQVIGPKGGKGSEITSTKGNPLPPTPVPNSTYKLVDATKHKK
ncbi:MAG: YjzC family protein [Chitinophagaceae bacterium]